MSELETKIKEYKKILKPYDILSIVCLVVAVIGASFLIIGVAIKDNTYVNHMFDAGIGIFASAMVFVIAICIVARKQYNEFYRLKKELREKSKKKQ